MATTVERLGIVETKVENLNEKMDDLKIDVKDVHDCLDRTRDDLKAQLSEMYSASCNQHSELAKEISELKSVKDKWFWSVAGGTFVIGWLLSHVNYDILAKLFGG